MQARGNGPRKPHVGILSPYLAGAYYGALISAITRVTALTGGRVAAIQTATPGREYHEGTTLKSLARVAWDRLDGFVTIANAVPATYLDELRAADKPVVTIGNEEPGFLCPLVLTDNRGGVKQAVEHLLGHGHTRIAFAGCLEQFDMRERYESYRDTLVAHGVEPERGLLFEAGDNVQSGGQAAGRLMVEAGLPSTAVVVATDLNAVGLMAALKEAGYVLPQDQAVVGFDDMPGSGLLSPSLSTVSQNFDDLGVLAAELLLRRLGGEPVAPGCYVVPATYVTRDSCGCGGTDSGTSASGARWAGTDPVQAFMEALGPAGGEVDGDAGAAQSPATKASTHYAGARDKHAKHGGLRPRFAELATRVRDTYQAAVTREPTADQLLRVAQACEEIYGHKPCQGTYDAVLALANQLSSEFCETAGEAAQAVAGRLNQCTAQLRLGLTKALLDERNAAYYQLREAIRSEYDITLDLLNNQELDPRLLTWLERTKARMGVLAFWQDRAARPSSTATASHSGPAAGPAEDASAAQDQGGAQTGMLDVVGTYNASGGDLALGARTSTVELFPPEELFEAATEGNVVSLFPVKSEDADWGFLAVTEPVDTSFVGQETYFVWSALFSEALDHRALLRSLSQRNRDLALSYDREREMARAVRQSEERYALAAQAANDGLWDWDLAGGTIYFSARWKEMLGYSSGAIGNLPGEWLDRVHPDDRPGLLANLSGLKVGESGSVMHEHRVQAQDGSYLWVLCRGLAVPGGGAPATRIVGSLTDVTERRALEERLRHQALYDSLTGLPNRVLFLDRLSRAIANTKRRGYSYAVLWLDLDNFKNLNDSLGHMFGDKLLVKVAERLRAQLREEDTAARFGGDEFAVLLSDIPDFSVLHPIVRRLLEKLRAPYDLDGHEVVATGSIGVATSNTGYENPEDVLRDADIAMYRAKSTGRGSFATFDASMHASAMARLQTETELRQAIEVSARSRPPGAPGAARTPEAEGPEPPAPHRAGTTRRGAHSLGLDAPPASPLPPHATPWRAGPAPRPTGPGSHLELHYQPVVDLETVNVVAFEALVRWRHPVLGLVPPLQFLQVAEESGLIVPMGRWVEAEACHQLASWHSSSLLSPGTRVSVNLSNREFWSPRFFEQLDRVLNETSVRPDLLAFEITEGVIMDDLGSALDVLHGLHSRQVQVHVDDFGTGYSSLQALHRLPIDVLKIDKSFVAGLDEDERTAELVRTIVQMGKNLSVGVIAEGVETAIQREMLTELGCPWGQGFLFSPALPASELQPLLADGHLLLAPCR